MIFFQFHCFHICCFFLYSGSIRRTLIEWTHKSSVLESLTSFRDGCRHLTIRLNLFYYLTIHTKMPSSQEFCLCKFSGILDCHIAHQFKSINGTNFIKLSMLEAIINNYPCAKNIVTLLTLFLSYKEQQTRELHLLTQIWILAHLFSITKNREHEVTKNEDVIMAGYNNNSIPNGYCCTCWIKWSDGTAILSRI